MFSIAPMMDWTAFVNYAFGFNAISAAAAIMLY